MCAVIRLGATWYALCGKSYIPYVLKYMLYADSIYEVSPIQTYAVSSIRSPERNTTCMRIGLSASPAISALCTPARAQTRRHTEIHPHIYRCTCKTIVHIAFEIPGNISTRWLCRRHSLRRVRLSPSPQHYNPRETPRKGNSAVT